MKNSPNEETHVRENTVAQLMIHFWDHQDRSSKVVLDPQVLSSRYQPLRFWSALLSYQQRLGKDKSF